MLEEITPEAKENIHPWRLCPAGQHCVRQHTMRVPPSKIHSASYDTTRREHCACNPRGKEQLHAKEIQDMAKQHFINLPNKPCPINLNFSKEQDRLDGNACDDIIAGWVQYWNDIFKPITPLTSNFVKALIASESGFKPTELSDKKNQNSARGLTQLTDKTRKILGDAKGELKNHLIDITQEDLNDPVINICAGIRWLFRKKEIATAKLKREATWQEAMAEYKGLNTEPEGRATVLRNRFNNDYLGPLELCAQQS